MAPGKSLPLSKHVCFALLVIVLLVVAVRYLTLTKPADRENIESSWQLDSTKLSDGDLIFRKGRDLVSRLVLTQGHSARFSHVGVIVKSEDTVSVIHALPEDVKVASGVQVESLNSFVSFENASDIAVYRFRGIDNGLNKKVKEYVLKQVGKPFDAHFLLSTDDSIYCTELAIKAFAYAGVTLARNLTPIKIMLIDERVIPPDHLRQSNHLKRIQF